MVKNTADKRKIAIIFGGRSSEYGVSLMSAYSVLKNINREKFEALPIGITRDGRWYLYGGDYARIPSDEWSRSEYCVPAMLSPDAGSGALLLFENGVTIRARIDAAFPVMHGRFGEDGAVQGLIELAGIPLVGCGVAASALCMDKYRAHAIASLAGVDVPADAMADGNCGAAELHELADRLGCPLYVKPIREGSSHGITRVTAKEGLEKAVELARKYDDMIIMEREVRGTEVGCAALDTKAGTITGEADEIELSGSFFDTDEKYTQKHSVIHVPARVDAQTAERIKRTALKLYSAFGCSGFARVDMFLTPEGRLVFNEVNTIPGFTEHSRFPRMLGAAGIKLGDALDMMIEYALDRGGAANAESDNANGSIGMDRLA